METSVVKALQAANLYKDTGRIQEQMLISILPNGERKEHKMSEIDYADVKIFADELEIALQLENEYVQSLFAKNAVGLVNLIRVINVETASGFKGAVGSGRQLDTLLLRAEQTQNPDLAGVGARASWIRIIGAAASLQFLVQPDALGANTHGDLTMALTEGIAVLGFANTAAMPCIDAVQTTYLAQAKNIQNCDFELANPFVGDAIQELKEPLYIYPQESGRIDARYYRAGTDETRPIGLWVKMSQNLRNLAIS
jgi:hypothetical protein